MKNEVTNSKPQIIIGKRWMKFNYNPWSKINYFFSSKLTDGFIICISKFSLIVKIK